MAVECLRFASVLVVGEYGGTQLAPLAMFTDVNHIKTGAAKFFVVHNFSFVVGQLNVESVAKCESTLLEAKLHEIHTFFGERERDR